jgi:hypothetical protein
MEAAQGVLDGERNFGNSKEESILCQLGGQTMFY